MITDDLDEHLYFTEMTAEEIFALGEREVAHEAESEEAITAEIERYMVPGSGPLLHGRAAPDP